MIESASICPRASRMCKQDSRQFPKPQNQCCSPKRKRVSHAMHNHLRNSRSSARSRFHFALAALLAAIICSLSSTRAGDAPASAPVKSKFPCNPEAATQYTAYRVNRPITIDGKLDEECWKNVPHSKRFVDILTGEPTQYDTRVAVLWDDKNLYVGYWLEEPDVQATFENHNDPIYYNNDAEMFIAGRDCYYEFEINAKNTIYEVFFIWQEAYDKAPYGEDPMLQRSHMGGFNGVGYTTHPRGPRYMSGGWRFPGIKTAVHIDGTLNNSTDKDKGWTVELQLPWEGMKWLAKADNRALPPKEGDVWRIDFSRFNQHRAPAPAKDSTGWVLSPHGAWDSHIPECFPYVHFSTNDVMTIKTE